MQKIKKMRIIDSGPRMPDGRTDEGNLITPLSKIARGQKTKKIEFHSLSRENFDHGYFPVHFS